MSKGHVQYPRGDAPQATPSVQRPDLQRGVLRRLCAALCIGGVAASTILPAMFASAQPTELAAKLSAPGPIAAAQSWWLEELTWIEVRDHIAAGTDTVIIPTGGIEENGPFLTTGKHNLILEATCPVIAKKLGNTLCAPIVKFVPEGDIEPPTGAMRFAGSISLSQATFEALLDDIASSLRQSGFRHIVLIGDSGGNQSGMEAVAARLNARWTNGDKQAPTKIHFVRQYYDPGWEATEAYTARELGVVQSKNDGHHDDIWVTAMMMVSDPRQVRHEERIAAGLASINGVDISDREKTIHLGQQMIEFRAALTADAIRSAIAGPE